MEAESGVAGGRARGTRFEGQQCGPGGFSASWRAFSLLLSPEFRYDAAQQCCPAHAAGEPLARGRGPGLPHRVQGGRTSSAWAVTGRTALIRSVTKDIVRCVCVCVCGRMAGGLAHRPLHLQHTGSAANPVQAI